jgi:hypothetical protein
MNRNIAMLSLLSAAWLAATACSGQPDDSAFGQIDGALDSDEPKIHDGSCKSDEENDKGKHEDKVTVCHVPPGNPANAHTICVGAPAVKAHLAKGSYLGPCKDGASASVSVTASVAASTSGSGGAGGADGSGGGKPCVTVAASSVASSGSGAGGADMSGPGCI